MDTDLSNRREKVGCEARHLCKICPESLQEVLKIGDREADSYDTGFQQELLDDAEGRRHRAEKEVVEVCPRCFLFAFRSEC